MIGGLTYGNIDTTNYGQASSNAWVITNTGANITPGNGIYVRNGKLFGWDSSYTVPLNSTTGELNETEVDWSQGNVK
jgi:hypothetical protein